MNALFEVTVPIGDLPTGARWRYEDEAYGIITAQRPHWTHSDRYVGTYKWGTVQQTPTDLVTPL